MTGVQHRARTLGDFHTQGGVAEEEGRRPKTEHESIYKGISPYVQLWSSTYALLGSTPMDKLVMFDIAMHVVVHGVFKKHVLSALLGLRGGNQNADLRRQHRENSIEKPGKEQAMRALRNMRSSNSGPRQRSQLFFLHILCTFCAQF